MREWERGMGQCENRNKELGQSGKGRIANGESLKAGIFTDKRVRRFQFRTGSCLFCLVYQLNRYKYSFEIYPLQTIAVILQAKAHRLGGIMGGSNLDSPSLRSAIPAQESNRLNCDVFKLSFAAIDICPSLIMCYWKGLRLYDKYMAIKKNTYLFIWSINQQSSESLRIYLISFPRFWTSSFERFWFLFWPILNSVTLKTSNTGGN